MNFSFDKQFLEKMTEGVILLNRIGKITHFNRAAQPWLNHAVLAEKMLGKIIAERFMSKSAPPVLVKLFEQSASAAQPLEVYLCGSEAQDYSLFITGKTTAEPAQKNNAQQADFLALLSTEIQAEMTQLREQLALLKDVTGLPAHNPIVQRADRLNSLIAAIDQLSKLNTLNTSAQSDRVSMMTLIDEVLGDLPHLRAGFSVNELLSDAAGEQGMLFGNKAWLKCGLRALLEGMSDCAPPRSQIELRVRQNGSFVVLTGSAINATGIRKTHPAKPVTSAHTALAVQADIRAPIARRIFELHGGDLKIVKIDLDTPDAYSTDMASFTLLLPTGRPIEAHAQPTCGSCPYFQQTELYANDLAMSMMQPDYRAGAGI